MRFVLLAIVCLVSLYSFSQVPDTTRKTKSKRLSLSKYPKPEAPPEKKSFVIITSDRKKPSVNDSWENEWNDYIEDQSRTIGEKVLSRDSDSVKMKYKVLIDFSVDEEGEVRNLKVTCTPSHSYIVSECVKMAINAPKKKSTYKSGKYARMHVTQPVEINVK